MSGPLVTMVAGGMEGATLYGLSEEDEQSTNERKSTKEMVGCAQDGNNQKTFAQALCKLIPQQKFKSTLRKPKLIDEDFVSCFWMWRWIL